MQTLIISRAILAILAVPIAMIGGGILALVLIFYAFTVHWIVGVAVLGAVAGGGYYAILKWEEHRAREASRPREE
jgi:hypothetical protein